MRQKKVLALYISWLEGEGACNNGEVQQPWLPVCLSTRLLPKAVISDPSADPWYLNKVLFSYPGSHNLCKLHTAASTEGVASTGLRAETDQN